MTGSTNIPHHGEALMTIRDQLETARKDLLDLSLRNSLLNFRLTKRRGIQIVGSDTSELFDHLVYQGRSATFLPIEDKEEDSLDHGQKTGRTNRKRMRLQTPYEESTLRRRLRHTYHDARTFIEERGVNILFFSLGMLEWRDDESRDRVLKAPILLVPVELDRSDARQRFSVKYDGNDLAHNISLQVKLKEIAGIDIPDLPEQLEDLDLGSYIGDVESAVSRRGDWEVRPNDVFLGFFSFGKFLMFNDLNPGAWQESKLLIRNPILSALLEDGFQDDSPLLSEEAFVDDILKPEESHQVMDADSSQLMAIVEVLRGKNLVIQGPPGTGKSQTITNLIAEAVGAGKRVLFVAEKMAALEVVKRRLDAIGLGVACLELHSHKANRKTILKDLKDTLGLGRPEVKPTDEAGLLPNVRDHLNEYCSSLHAPVAQTGLTPFSVIGELIRAGRQIPDKGIPEVEARIIGPAPNYVQSPAADQVAGGRPWTRADLARWELQVSRLQQHLGLMGQPGKHAFRFCRLKSLLPKDKRQIQTDLQKTLDSLNSLLGQSGDLASDLELPAPETVGDCKVLAKGARRAAEAPALEYAAVHSQKWVESQGDIQNLIKWGETYCQLHARFDDIVTSEAWDEDIALPRLCLKQLASKWWRFLSPRYWKSRKRVKALCRPPAPNATSDLLSVAEAVSEASELRTKMLNSNSLGAELFGAQWQAERSEWSVLAKLNDWLKSLHEDVNKGSLPKGIITFLSGNVEVDGLRSRAVKIESAIEDYSVSWKRSSEKLGMDPEKATSLMSGWKLLSQQELLTVQSQDIDRLREQIEFCLIREELENVGLNWVVSAAIDWPEAPDYLLTFFRYHWFESFYREILEDRPPLKKFSLSEHQQSLAKFRKLDSLIQLENRSRLALAHWEGLPRRVSEGQLGILLREFKKKRRHLPIRRIMQKACNAVQSIKPVFMMSPMSIASYLPPGEVEFDLAIFDEASQVRPVDAFGAIARTKQLVVVGDDNQLPPTRFFDILSANEEIDEEDASTSDIESILGLMLTSGGHQKMLRWHYRSRHESLIATSNQEFYDGRLVVFPSSHASQSGLGLKYRLVEEGKYDKGRTRTNRLEAKAVAMAVMNHAKSTPNLSLGVATFSLAQMNAVIDELELLRSDDPTAEHFFSTQAEEPFFVKNLESVQGDERDVIFISIGYGKPASGGPISMNFGALNATGGERRLNVLITRARTRCEVFTNMRHTDIDLTRTNARGVVALKTFLKYAETGVMDIPGTSGRPEDSPFEEEVRLQLEKHGYKVEPQVGSGGFYIDLAVEDQALPGSYLIGIECDGATYHSAQSARDRDRLRQQVLESLGWRIYRIWSTNWFLDTEREIRRLIEAVEAAKAARSDSRPGTATNQLGDWQVVREQRRIPDGTEIETRPYVSTALDAGLSQRDLLSVEADEMASYISQVVKSEGPVHFDIVCRRIVDASGQKRLGSRIVDHLISCCGRALHKYPIELRDGFLMLRKGGCPVIRDRSGLPAVEKKLEYVPPDELRLAISKVVENSCGIQKSDIGPAVVHMTGFGRFTGQMEGIINSVISKMIAEDQLIESSGQLFKSAGSE